MHCHPQFFRNYHIDIFCLTLSLSLSIVLILHKKNQISIVLKRILLKPIVMSFVLAISVIFLTSGHWYVISKYRDPAYYLVCKSSIALNDGDIEKCEKLALEANVENGDASSENFSISNLIIINRNLGIVYHRRRKYEKSNMYLEECIKYLEYNNYNDEYAEKLEKAIKLKKLNDEKILNSN